MVRAKSFGFTPRSGPGFIAILYIIINAIIIIIDVFAILYIIINAIIRIDIAAILYTIIVISILYIIIVIANVVFVIMFIVMFKMVIIFTFVITISSTIVRIITFKLSVMQHQTEELEMGGGCKLPVYCTHQGGATPTKEALHQTDVAT